MPLATGPELQIQRQYDNLAAYKGTLANAIAARTTLWSLQYAANDQTYENVVQGPGTSALDTQLLGVHIGATLNAFFAPLRTYFALPAINLGGIDQALTAWKWRVSQDFNDLYTDFAGSALTPANVFPSAFQNLGSYARTGNVYTPGVAIPATSGLGRVQAVVSGGSIGASNLTLTATLLQSDGVTTSSLAITFTTGATVGTSLIFGEQVLSGNAAAAQAVIPVAATAQFTVGQPVFISDSQANNNAEWGTVLSIITNTSITLTAPLRGSYLTASTAKVWPMFRNVTAVTNGGTGTNGDQATIKVAPDRVVAI